MSPRAGRESHSTASSSVTADMCTGRAVSLPFPPQSFEENPTRQCFAHSSMSFWGRWWLAGTGGGWREPAVAGGNRRWLAGTGGGWREPAVAGGNRRWLVGAGSVQAGPASPHRDPVAPLPSPPKPHTGGAALSSPKVKRKCFSNLMFILKAGIQRKEGWPWEL